MLVSKLFRAYGLYNNMSLTVLLINTLAFQSSFELTGYITQLIITVTPTIVKFQSSFELTGYITWASRGKGIWVSGFQSSFELTGYITIIQKIRRNQREVSKLFRAYGLYNLCSLEGAWILNPSGLFAIGFKKVDKNVFKLWTKNLSSQKRPSNP